LIRFHGLRAAMKGANVSTARTERRSSVRRYVALPDPHICSGEGGHRATRRIICCLFPFAIADSPVQLTRDTAAAHVIRSYEPGRIRIGDRWVAGHLIVSAEQLIEDWRVASPDAITVADLEAALALEPEIVLLGTGATLVWSEGDLMAALAARRVGLEIMSTPAACRTFNVLVHERRRVVAALFNAA
jgi:uncharacterized protein